MGFEGRPDSLGGLQTLVSTTVSGSCFQKDGLSAQLSSPEFISKRYLCARKGPYPLHPFLRSFLSVAFETADLGQNYTNDFYNFAVEGDVKQAD